MTLHHARYDKDSKWLYISRVNLKGKKVTEKWNSKIEIKGLKALSVLWIHQAIDDALSHSVNKQQLENAWIRKRINELEVALNPQPLFVEPLSLKGSVDGTNEIPNPHVKTKKASESLLGVRNIVAENIGEILDINSKS